MVTLTRYIKALCPQQAIDGFTPIVWHDVLGHLELAECREAAIAVSRRQPFIAPAELVAEIAAKRSVGMPHSNACREGDCRECRVSWCNCTCHPAAVEAVTAPDPGPRPAIDYRRQPVGPRREDKPEPRQLGPGDLDRFRRSP